VSAPITHGTLREEIVALHPPPLQEQIATVISETNSQNNRMTASPHYLIVPEQNAGWTPSTTATRRSSMLTALYTPS
jgi:hypothetical protein